MQKAKLVIFAMPKLKIDNVLVSWKIATRTMLILRMCKVSIYYIST